MSKPLYIKLKKTLDISTAVAMPYDRNDEQDQKIEGLEKKVKDLEEVIKSLIDRVDNLNIYKPKK